MFSPKGMALVFFLALQSVPSYSHAAKITYDLASLGGDDFRYEYTVENDGSLGAGVAVELIDIDFDTGLYQEASLSIVTPAALSSEWDEIILGSGPSVPAVYDLFALAGGIADSESTGGFAVEFTWLGGAEGPGNQTFQIFDPITFALLETGTTTVVPVPGALILLFSGLLGLGAFLRIPQRRSA